MKSKTVESRGKGRGRLQKGLEMLPYPFLQHHILSDEECTRYRIQEENGKHKFWKRKVPCHTIYGRVKQNVFTLEETGNNNWVKREEKT